MTDIRETLQKAEGPSRDLDMEIAELLAWPVDQPVPYYTLDFNYTINYIEQLGMDWVAGNVNGQVGGTPFAQVACTNDQASYSGTVILSLWLACIRAIIGDERPPKSTPTGKALDNHIPH